MRRLLTLAAAFYAGLRLERFLAEFNQLLEHTHPIERSL